MCIEGMDKWEEDEAKRRAALADQVEDRVRAKSEKEHQRHIALGWITENGEPGPNAPIDDEDDEDDEE